MASGTLITKFIDGAIVGRTYFSGMNNFLLRPEGVFAEQAAYPWLYPHIVPENGLPKPLAINKWAQPIKISFGMPNDLKRFDQNSGSRRVTLSLEKRDGEWNGFYYELNDSIRDIRSYGGFPLVEDEIKVFAEAASPIIDLPVSYLSPGQETKDDYGNIRINLFKDDVLAASKVNGGTHPGLFKRDNRPKPSFFGIRFGINGPPPPSDYPEIEPILNTRTTFQNFSRHVEGYFLSNEKNEIQMAVCYIWEGHKPEILRGLIRECLLRSMGFPGLTNRGFKEISLLGEWNQQNGNGPKPEYLEYFSQPFALTEKDRRFLELLYSESIQPGMDYIALYKTLENLQK